MGGDTTAKLSRSVTTSVVTLRTTMARKGIQKKIPRDCHVTDNFAGQKNAPIGLNGKVRPSGENQKIVGSPFFIIEIIFQGVQYVYF